jgi:uncharacterized lipoprotein YajG
VSPFHIVLLCLAAVSLAACAGVQDVVVHVAPHMAPSGPSALSSVTPTTVDVGMLAEQHGTGLLPGRIGERTTIGDVSMGTVSLAPAPEQLVTEALKAELVAAGHRAATGGPAVIGGEIERFDVHTDVTALYWDIVGTARIAVTVAKSTRSTVSRYDATCQERTYLWPTGDFIAQVLGQCIDDIARQFRDDAAAAHVLGG